MQGVFPILVTSFDEGSRLDEESLRRLIDFNLNAGVHGLGVALGSEVFKLTEAKRAKVTRIVVDQVAGRVPVVINTGAHGTNLAVHYSRMAAENGADALMVLPPSFMPAGPDEVLAYYRAISNAVPLPIFIQDVAASPISPGLARRLAQECEWVQYIKVETLPVSRITAQGTGLFYAVHKEILRHRGILRTATVRAPAPPMDARTRQELVILLAELYPDGTAIF